MLGHTRAKIPVLLLLALLLQAGGVEFDPMHPGRNSPVHDRILVPGDYHGNDVKARNGAIWFGLFAGPKGYQLRQVPLRVRRTLDPLLDDNSGKRVSVAGKQQPLFLVRGFVGLANRSVTTVHNAELGLGPSHRSEFRLGAQKFVVGAAPNGRKLRSEDSGKELAVHQVFLASNGTRTVLPLSLAEETAAGVTLRWAGDLDGDGKLDLLFAQHGQNSTSMRLFLSSAAKKGDLVAEVAFHDATGC